LLAINWHKKIETHKENARQQRLKKNGKIIMRIYLMFSICILLNFCNIFAKRSFSEDFIAMHEMTKAIGPGDGRTLFFIRTYGVIPYDSICPIIKDLFKNDFDSLRYNRATPFSFSGLSCSTHVFKGHSIMFFLSNPFFYKNYSLNVFVDSSLDIIAFSSLRWQYGFIEPPHSNRQFARQVKDKILSKYPYTEYIGCTKMKYKVIENNRIWPFWDEPKVPFWKWFKIHEDYLYNYELRKELIDKNISRKLSTIGYDLSFEIGPIINNKREFNIIGWDDQQRSVLKNIPDLKHWYINYTVKTVQNKRDGAQEKTKK
jgi:hypothetical protein